MRMPASSSTPAHPAHPSQPSHSSACAASQRKEWAGAVSCQRGCVRYGSTKPSSLRRRISTSTTRSPHLHHGPSPAAAHSARPSSGSTSSNLMPSHTHTVRS